MGKYIYVGILSSPFKMGKFIRAVTGFPYNHSVISFEEDIKTSYSFARRYKDFPFYGGFIKESILRYSDKGKAAIYKIPVSEEQYAAIKAKVEELFSDKEEHIYNLISAAFFVFGKTVSIKNAHTCTEFVLSMLKKYSDISVLKTKDFCSIKEFYTLLEPYKIYEGSTEPLQQNASWEGDSFLEEIGFFEGAGKTLKMAFELLKRITDKK